MFEPRSIETLERRLYQLKFIKDMKKDYYKHYPNIKIYMEICELISQIKYIENKIVN